MATARQIARWFESLRLLTGTNISLRSLASSIAGDQTATAVIGAALGTSISSPLDIPDCAQWCDASDPTTINAGSPSDDDPVSTWSDKSTSGYDDTQPTADDRPTYKADVGGGRAAIRFNPASFPQHLISTGGALGMFANHDGNTVFIVAKLPASNSSDIVLSVSNGAVPTQPRLSYETQVFRADNSEDNTAEADFTAWPTNNLQAGVFSVDWLGGNIGFASAPENGSSSTVTKLTPGVPATSSLAILTGADMNINGSRVDLHEKAIYTRALTAKERRMLLEYASEKWGTL